MKKKPIKYLFPFEKIPRGSKILLYGFGTAGRDYYSQVVRSRYCDVVAVIDGNYRKFEHTNFGEIVSAPDDLPGFEYDFIVISAVRPQTVSDIMSRLGRWNIPKEKIVCSENQLPIYSVECVGLPPADICSVTSPDRLSIVFSLGGGLGDYIVALKVFEILTDEVPTCRIDIVYRNNQLPFAECIYARQKNTGKIFSEKFYAAVYTKYDLAVTIEHFWIIDYWDRERVLQVAPTLCKKIEALLEGYETYCGDIARNGRYGLFMRRCIFWGLDRYTALGHRGVFPVKDKRVHIVLEEWAQKAYCKLQLPQNYVTMNYGAGVIQVKLWPLEYMGKLTRLIHKEFPSVSIVQIGGTNAPHIDGVNHYIVGEDLEVVKYILKYSRLHIDCEGGLVHLATQLGTKCCVLAGPTPMDYYGYEENINIVSDICKECDDIHPIWAKKCLRGFSEPECMYSITPEMVLERIFNYLNS